MEFHIVTPRILYNIPVYPSIQTALEAVENKPIYLIIGMATHGGIIPAQIEGTIEQAIKSNLSIINGMHDYLSDKEHLKNLALKHKVELVDIRKSGPSHHYHFWSGDILKIKTPRLVVLGTDCAIGKRTTATIINKVAIDSNIKTELITTGQTGWMLGHEFGLTFDSIPNDFVSGELEQVIVNCDHKKNPDLMIIEGQSSLLNPSGPCGLEFILSARSQYAVLQHAPNRKYYEGFEELQCEIPPIVKDINILKELGIKLLAITLNTENMSSNEIANCIQQYEKTFQVPTLNPLDPNQHYKMKEAINHILK